MKNWLCLSFFLPLLSVAQIQYPVAMTVAQTDTYFGKKVSDPYRWLEDPTNPETVKWASSEDSLTSNYMQQIPYHAEVLKRLKSAIRYSEYSAPYSHAGYEYYDRKENGKDHSVIYRRKGEQGLPEVVLDPDLLSPDHTTGVKFFRSPLMVTMRHIS
jgi:prolyl oligopeptidase